MNASESANITNQANLSKFHNKYLDCLNKIEYSSRQGYFSVECKPLDWQYLKKLKDLGYNTHYYKDNGRFDCSVGLKN